MSRRSAFRAATGGDAPATGGDAPATGGDPVVLGVFISEGDVAVAGYARLVGLTYDKVADPDRRLADRYRVVGLPSHFFIDRTGVLRELRVGSFDPTGIKNEIAAIPPRDRVLANRWPRAQPRFARRPCESPGDLPPRHASRRMFAIHSGGEVGVAGRYRRRHVSRRMFGSRSPCRQVRATFEMSPG